MADQHDPNGAYSEVFEEGMDTRQAQTVHRIRANSSIMQLKKILGERRSFNGSLSCPKAGTDADVFALGFYSGQSRRNP